MKTGQLACLLAAQILVFQASIAARADVLGFLPRLERITVISGNAEWNWDARGYDEKFVSKMRSGLAKITKNNSHVEAISHCWKLGGHEASAAEAAFGLVEFRLTIKTDNLAIYHDAVGSCSSRYVWSDATDPSTGEPLTSGYDHRFMGREVTCVESGSAYCVLPKTPKQGAQANAEDETKSKNVAGAASTPAAPTATEQRSLQ